MIFRHFRFGFLILNCLLLLTACTHGVQGLSVDAAPSVEASRQIQLFNQMGDAVYNHTLKGEYLEARNTIIQMSKLMPKLNLASVTTLSGLNAISDTLLVAEHTFNAVQLDKEQALFQSTRVRLMADALAHPETPLWLQYNKAVQESLAVMESANKQKNSNELKMTFNKLKILYLSVKPALLVGIQAEEVNKLESAFQFAQNELLAAPIKSAAVSKAIKAIQDCMEDLFRIKAEAAAFIPFMENNEPKLHLMATLAAIIILTLCYVAWRKRRSGDEISTIQY